MAGAQADIVSDEPDFLIGFKNNHEILVRPTVATGVNAFTELADAEDAPIASTNQSVIAVKTTANEAKTIAEALALTEINGIPLGGGPITIPTGGATNFTDLEDAADAPIASTNQSVIALAATTATAAQNATDALASAAVAVDAAELADLKADEAGLLAQQAADDVAAATAAANAAAAAADDATAAATAASTAAGTASSDAATALTAANSKAARVFLGTVVSEADMLAQSGALRGDWCKRSDLNNQVFELTTAGPGTLANWTAVPAGAVAFTALTDADAVDLPGINAPLAAALGGRAPAVDALEITADRNWSAADNGQVLWSQSASEIVLTRIDGLTKHSFTVEQRGAGVITIGGTGLTALDSLSTSGPGTFLTVIPRGTNTFTVLSESEAADTTAIEADLAALTDDVTALDVRVDALEATSPGSLVLGTVTGSGVEGEPLTGAWTAGFGGTRQWLKNSDDIVGETDPTYTPVTGDVGAVVTAKFGVDPYYIPAGILITAAPSSGTVIDDFNRADGAVANSWITLVGAPQIASGRAVGGSVESRIHRNPPVGFNRTVKAKFFHNGSGNYPGLKVFGRASPTLDTEGFIVFLNPDGSINFGGHKTDGTWGNYGSASISAAFPVSTEFLLEVDVYVSTPTETDPTTNSYFDFRVRVNGVEKLASGLYSLFAAEYGGLTATYAGLSLPPTSSGCYADDFDVVALA